MVSSCPSKGLHAAAGVCASSAAMFHICPGHGLSMHRHAMARACTCACMYWRLCMTREACAEGLHVQHVLASGETHSRRRHADVWTSAHGVVLAACS
jgi:hypothetical protein